MSNVRLLCIGLCCFLITAQSGYSQFPSQLHFENITTADGLSSNEITCFYQDESGFLWIGTKYGLSRYDGKNFQNFYHDPDNANSLSGNSIIDIIRDRNRIMWIATKDGGLTRFDPSQPKSSQFRQFINDPKNPASIPTNRLNCLVDHNDEYLLIGAEAHPAIWLNKKTLVFSEWTLTTEYVAAQKIPFGPGIRLNGAPVQTWIHRLTKRNDTLFLSFLHNGFIQYAVHDTIHQPLVNAGGPLTSPDFYLEGKKIWMTEWGGGLYMQSEGCPDTIAECYSRVKFADIPDVLNRIESFNNDLLIVSSSTSGLHLVDKKSGRWISYRHDPADPYSLASNKTTAVFKDKQGIWWIGTSEGISKYNPVVWQFSAIPISTMSDHNYTIFSVYEDDRGILRICTTDGIYKKMPGEKTFRLVTFSYEGLKLEPTMIYRFDTLHYILGTERSIFKYDPLTETIASLSHAGIHDTVKSPHLYQFRTFQIRDIVRDSIDHDPVLWFAPLGWGLGFYDFKKQYNKLFLREESRHSSIQNNLSRRVVLDKSGNVWVATSEGLYRLKDKSSLSNDFDAFLHVPGNESSLSSNDVSDIYVDDQNHMWISTNGGGLNEYDGKNFKCYRAALPQSNSMYGIYPDQSDRFWIPTANGFEVFDRKSKTFRHVSLPNPRWQLRLPTRILQLQDGSFAYGAGRELVTFHPDSIRFDDAFPEIYLSDFHLFNQSDWAHVKSGSMAYPYNKNFFTIFYSALQLSQPSSVRYQYKLDGLTNEWTDGGSEGKVSYTNLPPGNYTFKARVTNPFGAWSNEKTLVSFIVKPPFWYCWWFYAAILIFTASIVYLVFRLRVRQLIKIQNIRNKIANDLHDDIGSALSTISLYSEVAKMKTSEKEDELAGILDKITATSQEMQESMSYIVWSIQPRNDRFDQMVMRMRRYSVETLLAKNINVQFDFSPELHSVKFAPEKRKELFLLFKEAIHNISKYARCDEVRIVFSKKGKEIVMTISDNGVGFSRQSAFDGNGLHTMNDRAKSLKGKLHIHSKLEEGTTVELSFPV